MSWPRRKRTFTMKSGRKFKARTFLQQLGKKRKSNESYLREYERVLVLRDIRALIEAQRTDVVSANSLALFSKDRYNKRHLTATLEWMTGQGDLTRERRDWTGSKWQRTYRLNPAREAAREEAA